MALKKLQQSSYLVLALALTGCGGGAEEEALSCAACGSTNDTSIEVSQTDLTSGSGSESVSDNSDVAATDSTTDTGTTTDTTTSTDTVTSTDTGTSTDIADTTETTTDSGGNTTADAGESDSESSSAGGGIADTTNTVTPPSITAEPGNSIVTEGEQLSLGVMAEGSELTYQWYFDGQPIAGATRSQLQIENASNAEAGTYFCVVTNSGGTATSSSVIVSIIEAVVLSTVAVTWDAPTQREDGTALDSSEIATYRVYYGLASETGYSGSLDISGTLEEITVNELEAGEYKFAMSTIDTLGLESELSEEYLIAIR